MRQNCITIQDDVGKKWSSPLLNNMFNGDWVTGRGFFRFWLAPSLVLSPELFKISWSLYVVWIRPERLLKGICEYTRLKKDITLKEIAEGHAVQNLMSPP